MAKRALGTVLLGLVVACNGGKTPDTTTTTTTGTLPTPTTVAQAPIADNDLADVDEGDAVNINVAANDKVTTNPLALGSVTINDPPQFGMVTVQTNGTVDYTHDGSETTADSFTYTIEDSVGTTSNLATVLVSVGPVNDPPVANDDSGTLGQRTTLTLDIADNDDDVDDGLDLSSVTIVSQPAQGTVTVNGGGTVDYRHTATNQVTTDSFTYTIEDQSGAVSNTATVSLTISLVNIPPVAQDDLIIVGEGAFASIDVTLNDSDADNGLDVASITIDGQPSHGSIVVNANGTIDYTHDGSEGPADSFSYTIDDIGGATSNIAVVQVSVLPANDAPVAVDDVAAVLERDSVNIPVLLNDTDVDSALAPTSIAIGAYPSTGTLTVNANGTIDYQHDGSQALTDSFTYTVQDTSGAVSNAATVAIDVTLINDPPTAVDDSANVDEGASTTVAVLGNDSDSDDTIDTTTVQITSQPVNGSVTVLAGGDVQYDHDGSETLSDSFSYTVDDAGGGTSNVATVSLAVNPVNDPPVAVDDSGNVFERGTVNIGLVGNDSDVDGTIDPATVAIVSAPASGTLMVNANGSVDYQHDGSQDLTDSFTYTVDDDGGATSNVATVALTITLINDPPVAAADGAVVDEGSSVTIDLAANDSDPDDTLDLGSIAIVSPPAYATVVDNGDGTVDYIHDASETTADGFTYTISDAGGNVSNVATVSVSINPINDGPTAVADSASVLEGTSGNLIDLASNDSDPDDGVDPGSIAIVTGPSNGSLVVNANGTVSYDHDGSETTSDSFTYQIRDYAGVLSNTANVSITIIGVNDPPVAVNDAWTVNEGAGDTILVLPNDSDPDDGIDPSSVSIVSAPSNGVASPNAVGAIVYTHNGSETVSDSLQYTVRDFSGTTSNTATLTITILPVNDPPVANADAANVANGGGVNISVWSNDTDVDNALNPASISIVSGPSNGAAISNGNGTVDYFHDGSATVTDSFTYTIRDMSGATSNAATVSLTIDPPAGCTAGSTVLFYTGGTQTYAIPAGCSGTWLVEAYGAQGSGGNGGLGGYAAAEMYIAAGTPLFVEVGSMTGYNGGGVGWHSGTLRDGGGASDVRLGGPALENRVVVAGGGGASAGDSNFRGGDGGGGLCGAHYCGGGGADGYEGPGGPGSLFGGAGLSGFHAGGGGGGGLESGGTGSCNTGYTNTCGGTGIKGGGGKGDDQNLMNVSVCQPLGTAGGGGGLFGGGGSSTGFCGAGGGGGGSSYASPLSYGLSAGAQTGDGQVIISYLGTVGPQYIGSFSPNSGPDWTTTPPYTCKEACAQIFGGTANSYQCSTSDQYVDNRAHYQGWGTGDRCIQPQFEDYKLNTTYNCGSAGCAYSAWNSDGWCSTLNHCWQ